MRDIFFAALSGVHSSVFLRDTEDGIKEITNTIDHLERLSVIAGQEGLLSLDEAINRFEDSFEKKYLHDIIETVVDGFSPEVIEDCAISRLYSETFEPLESLKYLMYTVAAISIQEGETPYAMRKRLLFMLPAVKAKEVEVFLDKIREERYRQSLANPDDYLSERERNQVHALCTNNGDYGHELMKTFSDIMSEMDCKDVEQLIREMDNDTIITAMRGISCNDVIFHSIPHELSEVYVTALEKAGPTPVKDIVLATQKIFCKLLELLESGKIEQKNLDIAVLKDAANSINC